MSFIDGRLHSSRDPVPAAGMGGACLRNAAPSVLADICRHQSRVLGEFGNCRTENGLRVILERESDRLSILGSHACEEIERRRPDGEVDRNLRLEALIKADLAGNGYIEPRLLAEVVQTWGAR